MTESAVSDRSDSVEVEWRLFADLSAAAGSTRKSVAVSAEATVRTALQTLVDTDPELADAVLDDEGELQAHLTVLRNGQRVDRLDTRIDAGDELAVMPPVSGG